MVHQKVYDRLGVIGSIITSRVARISSICLLFIFPTYPNLIIYGSTIGMIHYILYYMMYLILLLCITEVVLESKDEDGLNQYLHRDDVSLNNTNQLLNSLNNTNNTTNNTNNTSNNSSNSNSMHIKDMKKRDLILHITTTWDLDESVAKEIQILVDLVLRDFIVFWFTTCKLN